ncbi:hypothetical protein D8674_026625 [Pyrus ussuriensis x Pyrus communis]|uniref:KIB1-4 beta-propeller domain-containing protein n=1 Tax=Pyrus ussuriensis x Pyrus communis TaxID=2448454 RepID=A0A5N5IBW9_9ROSA|nr:hypothetical protein D8674_026625 [Pyrus ussuriensis x Pyrus communis]
MPGDVRGAQELPWLLLPRICDDSMRFLSPFDGGKFHKLRVPEPIQRGRLFGSSKGWLFMVREKQKDMFLFNPISGAQRQLPSLTTIPSFQNFVETKAWKLHGASIFCVHTVLSTSDVDHPGCMVAAIFGSHVLGLCRPGDKTWSVFEVEHNFDDNYQDDQDDEVEEEENGKYFSDKEFDIDTEEENVIYSSDNKSDIDSEDENTIYSSDNESDIDNEDKNAIYSSDNESDIDDEDENPKYYRASCFRRYFIKIPTGPRTISWIVPSL